MAEQGLGIHIALGCVEAFRQAPEFVEGRGLLALPVIPKSQHFGMEGFGEGVFPDRTAEIGRASCRERVSSPV